MTSDKIECPYCGKESSREGKSKCYFCSMVIGDEYILYVDGKGGASRLCSTRCMDLLFESMEGGE